MYLHVTKGPGKGKVIAIPTDRPITLGRTLGDVCIADRKISRQHVRFWYKAGQWFMQDLDSSNGTYLNGRLLDAVAAIEAGDVATLGRSALSFGEVTSLAGEPAADEPAQHHLPARRSAAAMPVRQHDREVAAAEGGQIALSPPQPIAWPAAPRRRWPAVVAWTFILALLGANVAVFVQTRQRIDRLDMALVQLGASQARDRAHRLDALQAEVRAVQAMQGMEAAAVTETLDAQLARQREELAGFTQRLEHQQAEAEQAHEAATAEAWTKLTEAVHQLQPERDDDRLAELVAEVRALRAERERDSAQARNTGPAARDAVAAAGGVNEHEAAEQLGIDTLFLVDLSVALRSVVPLVDDELRYVAGQLPPGERCRVVVLQSFRTVVLPNQSAATIANGISLTKSLTELAEQTQVHDAVQLPAALRLAMRDEPARIYLLADAWRHGDPRSRQEAALLEQMRRLNDERQTQIHAIQFFGQGVDDALKRMAREYGGSYTAVPGMRGRRLDEPVQLR
ncbi:MAG: FHA domain-containing protein [Phycisphaeraceae bacterium]